MPLCRRLWCLSSTSSTSEASPIPFLLALCGTDFMMALCQACMTLPRSGPCRVKKSVHHHCGTLFSRSVARLRGRRAKKAMVYTILTGKQGKRVYTIGPEKREYIIERQTWKKKKRGSPRRWCILFLPCPGPCVSRSHCVSRFVLQGRKSKIIKIGQK